MSAASSTRVAEVTEGSDDDFFIVVGEGTKELDAGRPMQGRMLLRKRCCRLSLTVSLITAVFLISL